MVRAHRALLVSICLAGLAWVRPVAAQDADDVWVRPRLGVSALGGGTLGQPEGWMAGGSLRAGVQLGDWLSTYYQATLLYAALSQGTEIESGGDSDNAFVVWNTFLFETTLFDVVSIGAGPSADLYVDCEESVQAHRGCARDAVFFGMHGRVAVTIGRTMPGGARDGLTLSFEVHPTWFDEQRETVTMLGGIGFDLY